MVQKEERERKMDKKGEFKLKDELLNNCHATENKSDKTPDHHNDTDILDKSRSLTCSQSPIQSPSPVDRQPAISVRLISHLGPRLDDKRPSRQESSIAVPTTNPKIVKSASPSLSRSRSPGGHKGWFPMVISVLKME